MDDDHTRADVRDTYDEIATHFSATREYAWPEVESFVDEVGDVGLALDVGCGNGRHAEALAERAERVLGVDVSRALLAEARDRLAAVEGRTELAVGDATALPVADDAAEAAVYVATIHHLPSRADRVASLDELARALAPGGRGLVSAWSTAHDRFDAASDAETGFDATIDWTLPDGETVPRYYHVYAPAEFRRDLDASALDCRGFELSSGNCYAVVEPEGKRP